MEKSIIVRGARENNLKNIDVKIPRDKMTVIAGVSGSGKSSLAFNVLYGEGQRLMMDSFSTGLKRFTTFAKKPNVDSVEGLSPVIAVRQKTAARNPRSTIGTMTDIIDYIRVLYANEGVGVCPYCKEEIPLKTVAQITEFFLTRAENSVVQICVPIFKLINETYHDVISRYYNQGYPIAYVNDNRVNIEDTISFEENTTYTIEIVIDQVKVQKDMDKQLYKIIDKALTIGEGILRYRFLDEAGSNEHLGCSKRHDDIGGNKHLGCSKHHVIFGECTPGYFAFNNPESACKTCLGLGTDLVVSEEMLINNKNLSIKEGALMKEAFTYDKNSFRSLVMASLANYYDFSLDTPWKDLSRQVRDVILYGEKGLRIPLIPNENESQKSIYANRYRNGQNSNCYPYEGLLPMVDRSYQDYKKKGIATKEADDHYKAIMKECECVDCKGTKLKKQRSFIKIEHKSIDEVSKMSIDESLNFFKQMYHFMDVRKKQVIDEIMKRLLLLKEAGLGYVSLDRKSDTLSGGELQRVKLTSHIGSGLQGITYVLDEPSIGLHPKDNMILIKLMKKLRDIGNTVIVVEHDLETICSADHIIEIGPEAGVCGGEVIAEGTLDEIKNNEHSIIGQYMKGQLNLDISHAYRTGNGKSLMIYGAKENNLKNIDVKIPLGELICVTGVSGSGKSTLIQEVLYKKLYSELINPKMRYGKMDSLIGLKQINQVINIDQTPIGKNSRSVPATYMGFYDDIRALFSQETESKHRNYTRSRFSFNQKGGRCEECQGEGMITTNMHFMPSVEMVCRTCNGTRYNKETLEILYHGKDISEVLDMSVTEAMTFFKEEKKIVRKLTMMNEIGLGYLKIGQSSTTLSGGESQRLKLAYELSKKQLTSNTLYILDEPTTGLHMKDIKKLIHCLNTIVDKGNTVIVIEHNMEFVKTADYVLDLGPNGGADGGQLIAYGTPKEVAGMKGSYTGEYLKELFQ